MANIEALVMPKDPAKVEEVIDLVKAVGGDIKMAICPHGNIMSLPEERVAEVMEHPEVYGVYTGHIDKCAPSGSPKSHPQAFWNAYCASSKR